VGSHWDLYAQRIDADGVPRWTANGVAVTTAAGNQELAKVVSDGAGGAIVSWRDARSGVDLDIYANASIPPGRFAGGQRLPICTAADDSTGR